MSKVLAQKRVGCTVYSIILSYYVRLRSASRPPKLSRSLLLSFRGQRSSVKASQNAASRTIASLISPLIPLLPLITMTSGIYQVTGWNRMSSFFSSVMLTTNTEIYKCAWPVMKLNEAHLVMILNYI